MTFGTQTLGSFTFGDSELIASNSFFATDIATGAASIGAPVLVQIQVLPAATALATGAAGIATGTFQAKSILVSVGVNGTTVSIGAPPLVAIDHFVAVDLATLAASIAASALTQRHALPPSGMAGASVAIGAPLFEQDELYTVFANIVTASPSIGVGTFVQKSNLTATLTSGAAGLGRPIVNQVHAVAIADIPLTVDIGTPSVVQVNLLATSGLATGAAGALTATMVQNGKLQAVTVDTAAPVLFAPQPFVNFLFTTAGISTTAPALAGGYVNRVTLLPKDFATHGISFGVADIKQFFNLSVRPLASPSPSIPILHYGVHLSAADMATAAPAADRPLFLEQLPAPRAGMAQDNFVDEDGDLLRQAIFTNFNDDIDLHVASGSLMGRSSPGRGPAEAIQVMPPLYLVNGRLGLDISMLTLMLNPNVRIFGVNAFVAGRPAIGAPAITSHP